MTKKDVEECKQKYKASTISNQQLEDAFWECSCLTNNKIIILSENKTKFIINNPDQKDIVITTVDPCINIFKDEKKCDFCVLCEGKMLYVELKGVDIETGCEQLISSIEKFDHLHKDYKRLCFLVSHPKAPMSIFHKYQKKIFTKKNITASVEREVSF